MLAKKASLILGDRLLSWDVVSQAWLNYSRHMRTCWGDCIYGLERHQSMFFFMVSGKVADPANARTNVERGQHMGPAFTAVQLETQLGPKGQAQWIAWSPDSFVANHSRSRL